MRSSILYVYVYVSKSGTSLDEHICFSGSPSLCFITIDLLSYCFPIYPAQSDNKLTFDLSGLLRNLILT